MWVGVEYLEPHARSAHDENAAPALVMEPVRAKPDRRLSRALDRREAAAEDVTPLHVHLTWEIWARYRGDIGEI